jgi:V-type H+-transporting ATPase subunit a
MSQFQLTKWVLTTLQMTFAICLQLPNHLRFKNTLSIWTEFIPQIMFFHSIFGYLIVMIIAKWSTDWTKATTQPPNLLNMLIYMFLQPGEVEPSEQMYAGQGGVQKALLYLALVCVPWMLLVKPYILWREHKKVTKAGYQGVAGGEHEPLAREVDDAILEGEEEGEGHALTEDMAEEHVSSSIVPAVKGQS